MRVRLSQMLFSQRSWLKRFVFIRRPVLLKLAEFKLYVRLDDWAIGGRIALKRSYEAHVTGVMRSLLSPGMVVVDIGANIGYYSLLAASRVGDNGKVIAFEPGAENAALLTRSTQANGFDNVVVHPYAVSDADEIVGFNMDDSNGQIKPGDPADWACQVQTIILDRFLAAEPRIDLIKMDIEGAEGRALRGMQQLIRQHHPIIFTEFNPTSLPIVSEITPADYLNLLRAPGYDLFVLHRTGGRSATPQNNAQIMTHFAGPRVPHHLDLLALRAR
jgi:FkbM family methyltransferase